MSTDTEIAVVSNGHLPVNGHVEWRRGMADTRHVIISGNRYTRRRQDTLRARRARQNVSALPPVMAERDWVAAWIEFIDASVYTPPGTPRAGRILRESYADASIRLQTIRDLGWTLLRDTMRATPPAPDEAAPVTV